MNDVINALRSLHINSCTNIPIELVMELDRLRKEINRIESPKFVNEMNELVNKDWDEFKLTGLNNVDYITSEFYLQGFEDE